MRRLLISLISLIVLFTMLFVFTGCDNKEQVQDFGKQLWNRIEQLNDD